VFNIASGVGRSLHDLLDIIAGVTGKVPDVRWAEARTCDVDRVVLCTRRAEQYFGWRATTPIEVGIERMWHSLGHRRVTVSANDGTR
jgi:UDP-glucose 4-epimerase